MGKSGRGTTSNRSLLDLFSGLFEPLTATYQTPLTNYLNLQYVGELYMGSDQPKFLVGWNTGAGSLLLESSLCTSGCSGDVFQTGTSSSFAYVIPAEYDTTGFLDGATLYGRWATDKACPVSGQANSCVNTFPFVTLVTATGLGSAYDGILGMWKW